MTDEHSDWRRHIGGGFANDTAPFAAHPDDEERAFMLLKMLRNNGVEWSEAESEFTRYLINKSDSSEFIKQQMGYVREKFKPWLR